MTWNNRIIRKKIPPSIVDGKEVHNPDYDYSIREVYYDDKGNIETWWTDPARMGGESVEELHDYVTHKMKAFYAPVLEEVVVDGKETLIEVK